jgi:alkanesulfonate monooxygenase SsuD/methylene tetrahydromethanopterin reductase-like flavin-dependent oxidoreductase (luciferase family)
MAVAKTKRIKALVAARPGYVSPVQLAKMGAAFDRLSGGRLAMNLIAGQSDAEALSEGVTLSKEDRYALMDEDVTIMKALWSHWRADISDERAELMMAELLRMAGGEYIPGPDTNTGVLMYLRRVQGFYFVLVLASNNRFCTYHNWYNLPFFGCRF